MRTFQSALKVKVMLNKSVLNYYSHFSSHFPDFFPAIAFYSSRRIVSDKKNHVTLTLKLTLTLTK